MAVSTIDPNGLNIGQIGGTRNLIINGAMQVAQRGASATAIGSGFPALDRWNYQATQSGKFDVEQSTDAPAGHGYSQKYTVSTAYTVTSSDVFYVRQNIEAANVLHLGIGESSASDLAVSFWVKSSLTGTFGGNLELGGGAYVFSYTINSANTWEKKEVTITGLDSASLSLVNANVGCRLTFGLSSGSNFTASVGLTTPTQPKTVTGQTQLVETLNATWQITGVQLEVGDTATPFEHRSYGQELALCQRYYQVVDVNGTVSFRWAAGYANTGNMVFLLPTPMRSSATFTSLTTLTSRNLYNQASDSNVTSGGMTASLSIGRPTAVQIFVGSVSGSLGGSGGDPFIISGGSETLFAFDSEL